MKSKVSFENRFDRKLRMKISVAMAAYNGEKYIGEQIESILPQLGAGDEIVNANRYDAIFVQTKTREPPRQRYGRTLSAIPKPIHYRQVNQPYNSILGLRLTVPPFFRLNISIGFAKNGDTGLTTLGRGSFVIPPSYIFPYVCTVFNSSFLN